MHHTRTLTLNLTLLALAACGGPPPLAFAPTPVPVGHDGSLVHDAQLVDVDHDGDRDIVVATADGLRYLRCAEGRWADETPGTALERIAPVTRLLLLPGDDLAGLRDGKVVRLKYSGIGSWHEEPADVAPDAGAGAAAALPAADALGAPALALEADLNGDGALDRAAIQGRTVRVELRDAAGVLHDVTTTVAADGLALRGEGARLLAADLDGDGHTDLLAVGGRLLALLNNGGVLEFAGLPIGASLVPALPLTAPRSAAAGPQQSAAPAGAPGAPGAAHADAAAAAPRAWFTDVTEAAGVAFTHAEGGEQWDIRPTMGPGAAFADVDVDGDEDLYVVGGSGQLGRLFLNDGAGRFTDATTAWGLDQGPRAQGAGMGASFADWDDDGDPDLLVTRDGPNVMWRNDRGTFTDITDEAGTADGRWSASAAWGDIDRDGDLDLYVTNYLKFDLAAIPPESERATQRREDPLAMLPYVFPAEADALFRNEGGGRFTDISAEAGITAAHGKGLGVAFLDQDDDLWPDVYVANDTTPNFLWRNTGGWGGTDGGGFEEIALFLGLDDPRGGMGVALRDVDDDGDEDVFTSYWQTEPNGLYRNNAVHKPSKRRFMPRFEDVALAAGLAQPSVGVVGWGCALEDLDNDGDADLLVANGYTSPDYETTMICVGQPDHLYENVTVPGSLLTQRDVPRWELLPPGRAGPHFARTRPGRGLAVADVDADGDLDAVITANCAPLVLLRNERGGRSLRVVPEGDGQAVSRDAAGARVTLAFADGGTAVAFVRCGTSYLSGHERGVRFGLGARTPVSVSVRWPDGTETTDAVSAETLARAGGGPGGLRIAHRGS